MTKTLLPVAVFVILFSGSALVPTLDAAQQDSTPAVVSDMDVGEAVDVTEFDRALTEDVASAIRRYSQSDIYGWVTASVEDGVVTLDGVVREPFQRGGYGATVARVPDVARVINNLEVLPQSTWDDQIRLAAVNAIYSERTLPILARLARPPIHVIVTNGRVRLEGVVRNEMDRILAENSVLAATAAFGVINNLQIEAS